MSPSVAPQETHPRLRVFVDRVTDAVTSHAASESSLLAAVSAAATQLVAVDDWLPAAAAQPHPQYYRQYLLYGDPAQRFSVVSFVWGPGQATPIHDHTTWGVIAMLRGAERGERFTVGAPMSMTGIETLHEGDIDLVSPTVGDIHRVTNAHDDRVSISIHVYGGNIGRIARHVFDAATGEMRDFVSGYANADAGHRGYATFADQPA